MNSADILKNIASIFLLNFFFTLIQVMISDFIQFYGYNAKFMEFDRLNLKS